MNLSFYSISLLHHLSASCAARRATYPSADGSGSDVSNSNYDLVLDSSSRAWVCWLLGMMRELELLEIPNAPPLCRSRLLLSVRAATEIHILPNIEDFYDIGRVERVLLDTKCENLTSLPLERSISSFSSSRLFLSPLLWQIYQRRPCEDSMG